MGPRGCAGHVRNAGRTGMAELANADPVALAWDAAIRSVPAWLPRR